MTSEPKTEKEIARAAIKVAVGAALDELAAAIARGLTAGIAKAVTDPANPTHSVLIAASKRLYALGAELDAMQARAERAEARLAGMEGGDCGGTCFEAVKAEAERDASLARVAELEALLAKSLNHLADRARERDTLVARVKELEAERSREENELAAVLPEDFGSVEYILYLTAERDGLRAHNAELVKVAKEVRNWLNRDWRIYDVMGAIINRTPAQSLETITAPFKAHIVELRDAMIWMSGSPSFSPGGEAHEGWKRIHPVLDRTPAESLEAHDQKVAKAERERILLHLWNGPYLLRMREGDGEYFPLDTEQAFDKLQAALEPKP